jgi:transposase
MRAERARLSRHAETARTIDYMLTRWPVFTRFLDDGRICLTNTPPNGRCATLPWGAGHGCSPAPIAAASAAAIYTLIATAKLNNIDPQAWFADVLTRIADHPVQRLSELLLWHW